MKELNTQPKMEFVEGYNYNWKNHMFLECSTLKSRSIFSVTSHKNKDLRGDPSNAGTRP
jgi:hypothetical protein